MPRGTRSTGSACSVRTFLIRASLVCVGCLALFLWSLPLFLARKIASRGQAERLFRTRAHDAESGSSLVHFAESAVLGLLGSRLPIMDRVPVVCTGETAPMRER